MEFHSFDIRDEDLQPESRASRSQEIDEIRKPNYDGSNKRETTSDELCNNEENIKEMKLARAVISVASEGFNAIDWDWWDESFINNSNTFNFFKTNVFKAMTWFVWHLYDREDFENIAYTTNILDECKAFWEMKFTEGDPKMALATYKKIDMTKFEYIREQDIGNIVKCCYKETTSEEIKTIKEFSGFKDQVLLHPNSSAYAEIYPDEYIGYARQIINECTNILEDKFIRRHLMMELNDCKCFCVVDALYMYSWKLIPIKTLAESVSTMVLEDLVSNIHTVLYDLVLRRIELLRKCERLVTKTLSMFGSFDDDVVQVIEWADLERRTQRRRFITREDILTSLKKMGSGGGHPYSRVKFTSSKSIDGDTVYHLYQKSQEIANNQGYKIIGLKQLNEALIMEAKKKSKHQQDYVDETRITSLRWNKIDNNNHRAWIIQDSIIPIAGIIHKGKNIINLEQLYQAVFMDTWKTFVECERSKLETSSKNQQDDMDETSYANELWKRVDDKNDGSRNIKDNILTVVRKIRDPVFFPLTETEDALKKMKWKQFLTDFLSFNKSTGTALDKITSTKLHEWGGISIFNKSLGF